MDLNKEKTIELVNVSKSTWEKSTAKKKEAFINKAGYNLVGTYKIGRQIYYQVEPKGEELVEVINFLKEQGLPIRENPYKFIEFLLMIDNDSSCQMSSISNYLNVNQSTIFRWRKALVEKNIISYDEKALPARFKHKERELIDEKEYKEVVEKRQSLQEDGLTFIEADKFIAVQTGYYYRRVGKAASNGFFEDLFYLLEKASNQL